MKVVEAPRFTKAAKKRYASDNRVLDKAVRFLMVNPGAGEMKKGDFAGVRVYKFRMNNQLALLAYEEDGETLTLLALGSHENFYRDVKR